MFEKNITNAGDDFHPKNLSFKKILSITILLIILFSAAGLLIYLKPQSNKEAGIDEKKKDILNRLELYGSGNNPLKSEEKKEILEELSDTKIQEYNFSKEEKIKLLKALNN